MATINQYSEPSFNANNAKELRVFMWRAAVVYLAVLVLVLILK